MIPLQGGIGGPEIVLLLLFIAVIYAIYRVVIWFKANVEAASGLRDE